MGGVGSQAKPLSQGCESGWGSGLQVGRDPKTDSFLSPALPQGPVQGETESREVSLCPRPSNPIICPSSRPDCELHWTEQWQ